MGCASSNSNMPSEDAPAVSLTPKIISPKLNFASAWRNNLRAGAIRVSIPNLFKSTYRTKETWTVTNDLCLNVLAKDRKKSIYVVVKIVGSTLLTQRNREIEFFERLDILRLLQHPALPQIVDVMDNDNYYYIISTLKTGKKLSSCLNINGALCLQSTRRLIRKLLNVIMCMHDKKVAHHNVCPSNILVSLDYWSEVNNNGTTSRQKIAEPNRESDNNGAGTKRRSRNVQEYRHRSDAKHGDGCDGGIACDQPAPHKTSVNYLQMLSPTRMLQHSSFHPQQQMLPPYALSLIGLSRCYGVSKPVIPLSSIHCKPKTVVTDKDIITANGKLKVDTSEDGCPAVLTSPNPMGSKSIISNEGTVMTVSSRTASLSKTVSQPRQRNLSVNTGEDSASFSSAGSAQVSKASASDSEAGTSVNTYGTASPVEYMLRTPRQLMSSLLHMTSPTGVKSVHGTSSSTHFVHAATTRRPVSFPTTQTKANSHRHEQVPNTEILAQADNVKFSIDRYLPSSTRLDSLSNNDLSNCADVPENIQKERLSVDIFSIGVVYAECLLGTLPGTNVSDIMTELRQFCLENPSAAPDLKLIEQCVHKDTASRPTAVKALTLIPSSLVYS